MLILTSTILNLPVAALDEQKKIGEVKDLVFDPNNGELLGLLVGQKGFFLQRTNALSSQDILDFDKNGIVTKSEENLVELDEIVRIKKSLHDKIKIIGQKAVAKSGKKLGHIYDLLIDADTLVITKYYIKDMLEERIIPANCVVEITPRAVVFSDDVIEAVGRTEMEGAAA